MAQCQIYKNSIPFVFGVRKWKKIENQGFESIQVE